MISLASKTNVDPPSGTYPFGNIKNDTGVGDGTPVDVETYADQHQFFSKLMDIAGITPNDLAENATNGFQLIDALAKFCFIGTWTSEAIVASVPSGTITQTGSLNFSSFKQMGNTLLWNVRLTYTVTGSPIYVTINIPTGVTGYVTGMQVGHVPPCTVDSIPGTMTVGSGADGTFVRCNNPSGTIVGGTISFCLVTELL